tara:strand:- start:1621 stop:2091 length:471 start_codon:yes stop_codon:yes gene_type:complete
MRKTDFLFLLFAFILSFNTAIAQNDNLTGSRKVFHIKTYFQNKNITGTPAKKKNAIENIKNQIFMSADYSYIMELDNDEFILITNNNSVTPQGLHSIFYSFIVKVFVLNTKPFANTTIDISSLPIYTNQKITSFNKEILKWENKHKSTLAKLKSQF